MSTFGTKRTSRRYHRMSANDPKRTLTSRRNRPGPFQSARLTRYDALFLKGDAVRRREFITLLGGATGWPLAVCAQQPARLRRIGVLIGFAESDPAVQSWLGAFRGTLAKL